MSPEDPIVLYASDTVIAGRFRYKAILDAFERLLWWLFVGSAGARTRAQVLRAIREQPRNAQQLSQYLRLDYTTVRHHLGVLERNRIIITEGEKYGKVYFISDSMESHWSQLEAILKKMRGGMKGGEQSK